MLEDEDDGASRSLVRPDMATAQTKFIPYTRSICPEIVWLPNVIASPDAAVTIPSPCYHTSSNLTKSS